MSSDTYSKQGQGKGQERALLIVNCVTLTSSSMLKNASHQKEPRLPKSRSTTSPQDKSIRAESKKMDLVSKSRMMGPNPMYKSRRKAAIVSSVEEDIDLDKEIDKERCSDESDCMWLSSETTSPSSFFEEYGLCDSFHLPVDKWLISWLSTLASSYLYLDESRYIPEAACLAPGRRSLHLQDDLEEIKRLPLLPESQGNGTSDSTTTSSESSRSSRGQCLMDCTSCDEYSTSCDPILDSCSEILEMERVNLLVSLVNPDNEDCSWISDGESELESFKFGLSSPSGKSSWFPSTSQPTDVKNEHPRHEVSFDHTDSKAAELEDLDADDPLFWPFEQKINWSSDDAWKRFSMSPRRGSLVLGTSLATPSKYFESKFQGVKKDFKQGCSSKLMVSAGPAASKISEPKPVSNQNSTKKKNPKPSGLRKLTKMSMKVVPLETIDGVNVEKNGKICIPETNSKQKDFLEDDFASNAELPIETLVGLGEFDGHEGIDLEFKQDVFLLDDIL